MNFLSLQILFLSVSLLFSILSFLVTSQSPSSELEILLKVKQQWRNQPPMDSWSSTISHCNWPGINCTDGQSVTGISLHSQNIMGEIPPSICHLKNLTFLDLGNNSIPGKFPTFLYNCTKLQSLDLSYNYFVGELPNDINKLSSNLQNLGLSVNNFTGDIPISLGQLTGLISLYMDSNKFGTFPAELGNLENLEELVLAYNSFSSMSLPKEFGKLKKLKFLWMTSCNLIGEIPQDFANLTSLEHLDLSNNKLVGEIPKGFANLTSLEHVDLSENNFVGEIPSGLFLIENLTYLYLYTNRLSGSLPASIKSLNLVEFDVSLNNLTGPISEDFGKMSNLKKLFLFQNQFNGTIPHLFMAPRTIYLALNDNNFTGSLPLKLSKNMASLELSNNKFSGIIPSSVSQWRNLSTLRASNNNLCGNIPVELTALSNLITLELDGNQLSGNLPERIISWKSLLKLNLARNKLSGQLPEALGSLPNLYDLDLSHNNLLGKIPSKLAQLKKGLSQFALNLSSNSLTGEIPRALDNEEFRNSFFDNANLCTHNHISNLTQCSTSRRKYIILILFLGATIFMMFLYFTFFKVHIGKKEQHNSSEQQEWKLKSFHRVEFTEKMIVSSLDDNNKIGSGGSGKVYRVVVNDSGGKVAVKRIWNGRKLEGALEKQFSTEVEILGTIRHANIVKLLCYVSSAQDKLLVYEYVENQSLDKWLHGKMEGNESSSIYSETSMNTHAPGILDWGTRLKIAIGAAKGLCYLHYDCSPSIVHRDVKSSNILLDSEFNAKIADFGLAMVVVKNGEPQTASEIKGSFGYMAPEYCRTKKLNVKIDVYSFGVVLLEMVTGKEACKGNDHLNLADWSWQWYCEERPIVDALDEAIKEPNVMKQMVSVFKLGLICTSENPVSRPNMKQVLQVLTMNSHHENNSHPQTVNDE